MGDLVPLRAGWAVWSKHPGTRDDYSVLHSSDGPLSQSEFTSVLAHYAPGNPPAQPGMPSSLPWVTVNRVGVADKAYIGVSVHVPTEHVDATGRPISKTSYLCAPYDDLARDPVCYAALSQALSAAQLPLADGGLVTLTVPRLDKAELAEAVIGFGADTVAVAAAMVLAGPATITGPDLPDVATRVRFFDAVAALLPYGHRASFTAASWSDTGAGARFRIVFANRAREETSRLTWGTPARGPADGPARGYLEYLRRITAQPMVDVDELARLIGYLSQETTPSKFEQPEQAVASLAEFFRAATVLEAFDAGNAETDEIRQVFERRQDDRYAPERRREMFGRLIAAGRQQDWSLVSQRFSAIANGEPQHLLPSVVEGCCRSVWGRGERELAAKYLRLAGQYGQTDELLAKIIAKPGSAERPEPGLVAAASLLAEFVTHDPTGPTSRPRTQEAVAMNPSAGAALLAQLCGSRQGIAHLGVAVEWLEPVLDGVLPLFNAILGEGGGALESVGAGGIDQLNRDGGLPSVLFLLRAASYRQRLNLVLPGLACWLAAKTVREGSAGRSHSYWADAAMELLPPNSAADAAWLNLALLSAGDDPRSLFAERFPYPELNAALVKAWEVLVESLEDEYQVGRAADDVLVEALVDFLGRYPWRDSRAQASAVEDLAARLCVGNARSRVKAAVFDPVQVLRQLPPQAAPEQIAQACARAGVSGLSGTQVAELLAESGVVTSGAQAAAVIDQLHRELLSVANGADTNGWEGEIAQQFADGTFGQPIAAEFTRRAVRRSRTEITRHLHLLAIAAETSAAAYSLDDADAEALEQLGRGLSELAKTVRKQQGGRLSRRKEAKEAAGDPGS